MKLTQPVPELPVPDVQAAQAYYRDNMGFDVAWYNAEGDIGAVSHGDCAIFFRQSSASARPAVFWLYSEDVDAAYAELKALGAQIDAPPEDKPWNMRQFTLRDHCGNAFYVFRDL